MLVSSKAPAIACARLVDALADADLQALIDHAVDRESDFSALTFLAGCLCHAPLVRRMVERAGLPLILAKLLADEGGSESKRVWAAKCIDIAILTARESGPPPDTWAKPIIKPLRAAFVAAIARDPALGTSSAVVCSILVSLASESNLRSSVASGLPDFVAALRGGGHPADLASTLVMSLAPHPGARAAALRAGAVPALVSLLSGADGAPSPAVRASCGEEAAGSAFRSLGTFSLFDDSRAAILATDASSRLRGTLLGSTIPGLASDNPKQIEGDLFALSSLLATKVLPVASLIDTGALARGTQLLQSGNLKVLARAAKLPLVALAFAGPSELQPVIAALRAVLRAFGPASSHPSSGPISLFIVPIAKYMCRWAGGAPEPPTVEFPSFDDALPWQPPENGRAFGELLVTEGYLIPILSGMIRANPEYAFTKDLRGLSLVDAMTKGAPFYAGRILHYLDCYAGPAVAARLARLVPEPVLRAVRAAAASGRWGRPMDAPPGEQALGEEA